MSEQKTIRQYAEDYSIGLNEREAALVHAAYLDGAAKQKELDAEKIKDYERALMKTGITIFLTIISLSFLSSLHTNLYNKYYDECVQQLIEDSNYKDQQQAFDCVKNRPAMIILGTILFREGSIFERIPF